MSDAYMVPTGEQGIEPVGSNFPTTPYDSGSNASNLLFPAGSTTGRIPFMSQPPDTL